MPEKLTFGAASRSSPSLRWNSSRYSSGTSPTSRKLITCPSFIAAPFIVPSAVTICSAASMWRRSSAALRPSSERARFVARVPRWRAACPAARLDTRAVRAIREVGILSLAMAAGHGGRPPQGVGAGVTSAGGVVSGVGTAETVGVGVTVGASVGASVAVGVASGAAVSVASGVAVGVASSSRGVSLPPQTLVLRSEPPTEWPKSASSDAVTDDRADHRGQQAGDDRELPAGSGGAGRLGRAQAERVVLGAPAADLLRAVAARADAGRLLGAHRGAGGAAARHARA